MWLHSTSWKKNFCSFSLQAFGTADTLKCHINECFKIYGKQKIKMSKKWTCEQVTFKNY